jgi:hypothetical protein
LAFLPHAPAGSQSGKRSGPRRLPAWV